MSLTNNEIQEFKSYLSQAPRSSCRKLTGQQMSKLKKSHFNEYIKKIKYYARKDLEKITQKNTKLFYETDIFKDYQNKQKPTNVIKKPKPLPSPQKQQPNYYFFGQAEISSMKKFIFLAEQCHKLETRFNKVLEKQRNQDFVEKVEKIVQKSYRTESAPKKSLNLFLTVKSAKKIDHMTKQRKRVETLQSLGRRSYQSIPKSFGSTNFSSARSNSLTFFQTKS